VASNSAPTALIRWIRRTSPTGRRMGGGRLSVHAPGEAGFTLVEVIVALAILSIGIGVVGGLISSSLRRTAAAERMAEAGSMAQSLLAEVGADLPIESGERNGQFPNGYLWHLKMQPYGSPAERGEWPVGAYVISTEVEWQDRSQRRSYMLTTLRFGPGRARQ